MKKLIAIAMASLLAAACVKQNPVDEQMDKWNGYESHLKMGEQIHTLWAGKNQNVGTATYGIDEDANFYVTYDCNPSGWTITETHMFAGDKLLLPRNKPGNPKIGQFPNSGSHGQGVSTFTYYIPLSTLPPCEEPGFVVASHCVVRSPAGRSETAWAEGDFKFTDKDWGWYDVFYFNQQENQYTILYGIRCSNDSLRLYHLDVTHRSVELTYVEYVGNTAGTYNGAANDIDSGVLFFAKVNENELWVNSLSDEDSSFMAGSLQGQVLSATYHDGLYYYVDALTNSIHRVAFNDSNGIESDKALDTIPGTVTVNDIAMGPDGDILYIMGNYNDGGSELITWDVAGHIFTSTTVPVSEDAQIAFGSDGFPYGMEPADEPGDSSIIWVIDTYSDSLTVIPDEIIFVDDPFADLSGGPTM